MQLKSGTLLQGGKYRVESVLGQGGFGITYMAVQSGLNRKVAIKEFFMKEHCNRDEDTSEVSVPSVGSRELVERFKTKFIKEAQTIAALSHPNIVDIYDVFSENGTAYYVMKYHGAGSLSGMDLPMAADKAVGFIRQISSALSYLHDRNIMHLDVKPSNVLIDENGNAVLIDFGVSKHYDEAGNQTSTALSCISKGYAPIEQYSLSTLTFSPATDIYAVGATLYKLLTGDTPPEASVLVSNPSAMIFPPSFPSKLASLIRRCMASSISDRPQSVGEFLALLDAALEEPVADVGEGDVEETDVVVEKIEAPDSPEPPSSGRRRLWWLLVLILGLVAGVVSYVVFSGGEDGGPEVSVVEPAPSPVPPVKPAEPVKYAAAYDMSSNGRANCYVVSKSGTYKFRTVKGNSNESVGRVAKAEVLWESFGTSTKPSVGALVRNASYNDGYITFETASTFREGNAVIAAKDASGNILWSWHIWLTDQPQGQVYYNNAGTMMDRNLGATSAAPGEVGALGLLYQWGRKDPFLGSSSINSSIPAESSIIWPSAVRSSNMMVVGMLEYSIAHPTTFITGNSDNEDWYYTGASSTYNTRWTTCDKPKSIYDPCPSDWRVPDGGKNGIWANAGFGSTTYDAKNRGFSYSTSTGSSAWYPAAGYRSYDLGTLGFVGDYGYCRSATVSGNLTYTLYFYYGGDVSPLRELYRASGYSVRCCKE